VSDKPLVRYATEDDIAIITVDNPPVNALSPGVPEGIIDGVRRANADPAVRAIVLIGAGRSFIAGADIRQFGTGRVRPPIGQRSHDILDGSEKPVVAAIHGFALGGGLENAMGCNYRIAARSAKVGLPEVLIGILPGGGGTQRLPRVAGPKRALEMIVSGRHVPAPEALEYGVLDRVVDDSADLRAEAVAFAKSVADVRPLPRISERSDKLQEARDEPGIFDAMRKSIARRARNQKAPYNCIAAVEAACTLPFQEGLAREQALFQELENAEIPGFRELALYHQARIAHAKGDTAGAVDRLKKVIEKLGKEQGTQGQSGMGEEPNYLLETAKALLQRVDPKSVPPPSADEALKNALEAFQKKLPPGVSRVPAMPPATP